MMHPDRSPLCPAITVSLMLLLALLTACASDPEEGYAWQSAYRQDITTVNIPMFDNTTFAHGLEVELTDALVKEIHRTTPWKVVSTGAETTLEGAITGAELLRLSRQSETGLVQEQGVELTVSFQWKKNASGEILVARRNFRATDVFTPARGANERLGYGQRAAVDRLAKEIVASLRSSW